MRELNERLRAVIRERYGGSVRAASKDLGLDPNSLQTIVDSPRREPRSNVGLLIRLTGRFWM